MELDQMIFDDLIKCYKSKNYRFDFVSDELFVDGYSKGVYIHFSPLNRNAFLKYIEDTPFFFDMELPMQKDTFLDAYLDFMDHACTKKRNTRYAVSITVLYPKKLQTIEERERFIRQYVLQLCGLKQPIPYFVENITMGCGTYARITMIDRIYIARTQWMVYKKDGWFDSRTGRFASADCPERYKVLKYRAGDYRLDKDGNRIPSKAIFSNSLQNFVYGKDMQSGRNLWDEFIWKLRQKFLDTVLRVCGKTDHVKKGKRLHKTECKPEYHRYVRRRIAALNFAKQTIEYTTNYLLKKFCAEDIVFTHYNEAKGGRTEHSRAYKQVLSIFHKYRTRFRNGVFHDETGNEHQLDYYHQNVYELDRSIQCLLDQFFTDIQAL